MIASKVISVNECNELQDYIERFREYIKKWYDDYENSINTFNSNPIAQSFYESGPFGKQKEEEFKKIKQAIDKFMNAVDSTPDTLVPKTKSYIDKQLQLLNSTTHIENIQ